MQFPENYFEDEVREGFYVPGLMKRAWAAQLEVLEEVAKVCEQYHIKWFIDCGTLLGAVRHGGYIPWDDDLDICMLREDYNRFNEVATKGLPSEYEVLNVQRDARYKNMFTRVTNGKHIRIDREHLEKYHEFPYVAGIDIFPLDYLASNAEDEAFRKNIAKIVSDVAAVLDEENRYTEQGQRMIQKVETLCGVKLWPNKPIKQQLYVLLEQLFSLYTAEEATDVALMPYWIEKENHKYPLECFKSTVMLPYENTKLPAPLMYERVLEIEYRDFMKNVRSGGVHDYPFFKGQEVLLTRLLGGTLPYKYVFSPEELQVDVSRNTAEKKNTEHKEIVFLPYKASAWNSFESVWKAAMDDPDCDVYVVPIPYYDKKGDNTYGEMHYDGDKYPAYVPIIHYNEYDFEKHHPDMIFIHNPYDQYNYTMTVPPFFYAKNLKKYTDKLVYIPYFVLEEINPNDKLAATHFEQYITMPGVVHADSVIVQSEQMRDTYIEALVAWAGEDTRTIWEEKILGLGSPINDANQVSTKANMDMPLEWREKMLKPDGTYKKVILYNTSVSTLMEHKETMLEKMHQVFETFAENKEDITLLWRPHPFIKKALEEMKPGLQKAYNEMVQQYKDGGWGIYDDTEDLDRAIAICDAYYGDKSSIAQTCQKEGKPVMIQSV